MEIKRRFCRFINGSPVYYYADGLGDVNEFGESCTDVSKFIPGSDSPHTADIITCSPVYDTQNGKDPLEVDLSQTRRLDLERSEVDYIVKNMEDKARELLENEVKNAKENDNKSPLPDSANAE